MTTSVQLYPPAHPGANTAKPVLTVAGLNVSFFGDQGELPVVRDLDFEVRAGETLALVGESGCGKSVTALAIMGLLEASGRVVSGSVRLGEQELTRLDHRAYQALRGRRLGMVFQEPMTSLNPVFTVGEQIGEVLVRHFRLPPREARAETLQMLKRVRLPSPEQRIDQYPHELSGGMKQRVMIAMALACQPDLLIADEPTTALDVTVQAQILQLLQRLQAELGMAILLITHNLGVVAQYAQRVVVMYAGELAESADVVELFRRPLHPYTRALLESVPVPGRYGQPLPAIAGNVPTPLDYPAGCRFSTRCPRVLAHCPTQTPPCLDQGAGHAVACWLYQPGRSPEPERP